MAALLRAEGLTRILPGENPVTLVEDAALSIEPGEFVAIVGASGSGKSSLLYLLGLLDRPTRGRVWFDGVDTTTLSEAALADLRLGGLGFVFQFHFLLPEFTALENVMLPMRRLGRRSEAEARQTALSILDRLGVGDQGHKLPRQMSGGQSQRVAIARALANEPRVVLADEPTGNLDSHAGTTVQEIVRDLTRERDRAVVVVTHDRQFATAADRVIPIVDGRIEAVA